MVSPIMDINNPETARRLLLYFFYEILGFKTEIKQPHPDFIIWLDKSPNWPTVSLRSELYINKANLTRDFLEFKFLEREGEKLNLTSHAISFIEKLSITIAPKKINEFVKKNTNLRWQDFFIALFKQFPAISSIEIRKCIPRFNPRALISTCHKKKAFRLTIKRSQMSAMFILTPTGGDY